MRGTCSMATNNRSSSVNPFNHDAATDQNQNQNQLVSAIVGKRTKNAPDAAPMKKCSNAAESSSGKVKHTLKDGLSGMNESRENEDDHDLASRELTPEKKRANAVELSSSRKKGKHTAHDDDQENMKERRKFPFTFQKC